MRLLIAVLLLSACGGKDHDTLDAEPESFFAVIFGRVVNDDGVGVVNAQVRATAFATCSDSTSVGDGTTRSTADGRYSVRVRASAATRHCVRLFATPPSQSLLPDSVQLDEVLFARVPGDSVQQGLTLRLPGGGGPGGPINPHPVISEE